MVMMQTHMKDPGQRSIGLKDRVETDRQTDGWMETICITSRANVVSNKYTHIQYAPS